MRVKLDKNSREKLFSAVLRNFGNVNNFSKVIKVNRRTISDWRRGFCTIPLVKFNGFLKILNLKDIDFNYEVLSDYWHAKDAGRKAGLITFNRYGSIGTPEGRKKGGLASQATHKKRGTLFHNIKSINEPVKSEKLAEFMGIMFGDGHLSDYQASITTSSITDKEHALHAKKLIKELFDVDAYLKIREKKNTAVVVASSRRLVKFLNKRGMPVGNKLEKKLTVPGWVRLKKSYKRSFIRGLFDTDGSIYLDKHKIKSKIYKHLGWTITSYADNLIVDIMDILRSLGFSPTNRFTQKSVYLRRQNEIAKYFREIKTNNPKHNNRYERFIGEVPKWS